MADNQDNSNLISLQNYAKSLKDLVVAMRVLAVTNTAAINVTTNVTKDLHEDLIKVHEDLIELKEVTKTTHDNTESLLMLVKSIKKDTKRKSVLDKLNPKENAKNIGDGIKTIALMAGSILALGTSFKILGEVDFKTVLALSAALPLLALGFDQVGDITKNYSTKELLGIAGAVIGMSAAVATSGFILNLMPTLSFKQMASVIAVSAALGISMYAMANAADNIGPGKIKNLYALLPAIPLTALAISLATGFINSSPDITFKKGLSFTIAGLALGATLIPLSFAASIVGKNIENVYALLPVLPATAAAIALSSQIISMGKYTNGPTVEWAKGTAASLVEFGLASTILGEIIESGIGPDALLAGAAATIGLASAIVTTSEILATGNYGKYPNLTWATGVGASIGAFGLASTILGEIIESGIGAVALLAGAAATIGLAGTIVTTAEILNAGTYGKYPNLTWATGVGASIGAFGLAAGVVGGIITASFGIGALALYAGVKAIEEIAWSIVRVSYTLSNGKFTGGPSKEWAGGVSASLMAFIVPLAKLNTGLLDKLFGDSTDDKINSLVKLGTSLKDISFAVAKGKYTNGPTVEWAKGIAMTLQVFSNSINEIKPSFFDRFFGDSIDSNINSIVKLGLGIKDISFAISGGKYTNGPTVEWTKGIAMSLQVFSNSINQITPSFFDRFFGDSIDSNINSIVKLGTGIKDISFAISGGKYTNAPDFNWAHGIGTSLLYFSKVLDNVKPSFWSSFTGDTLFTRLSMMKQMAKVLPEISKIISTGSYTNSPSKEWTYGVGNTIKLLTESIKILGDNDVTNTTNSIEYIKKLGPAITILSKEFSSDTFDNYPTLPWTNGITNFINKFSTLQILDKPDIMSKKIAMLSRSYSLLAHSMITLGNSMKGIKDVPDMTGLYGGLVTLSVVDANNLDLVLEKIDAKKEKFQSMLNMIKVSSNVKIDDNVFAFNKAKAQQQQQQTNNNNTVVAKSSNKTITAVEPIQINKQQNNTVGDNQTTSNTNKLESLLSQLVGISNQMNSVLLDISDNTEISNIHKDIISNS